MNYVQQCCLDRKSGSLLQATDSHVDHYMKHAINLLWLSDAIWHQKTLLTLVQVRACFLTAPSHYLNQCWLNHQSVPLAFTSKYRSKYQVKERCLKNRHIKLLQNIPGADELKLFCLDIEGSAPSTSPWNILGVRSANERGRYIVTPPLIGWAHTQNDPSQKMGHWDLTTLKCSGCKKSY